MDVEVKDILTEQAMTLIVIRILDVPMVAQNVEDEELFVLTVMMGVSAKALAR